MDFATGFITGRTPDAAVGLIESGQAKPRPPLPTINQVGVMDPGNIAKSMKRTQTVVLGANAVKIQEYPISGGAAHPRDKAFIDKSAKREPDAIGCDSVVIEKSVS